MINSMHTTNIAKTTFLGGGALFVHNLNIENIDN